MKRSQRWMAALIVTSTVLTSACTPAGGSSFSPEGDYPAYSSDTALIERADAVVLGDVLSERSDRIEGFDYRVVSAAVITDYKSTYAPGDVVEVKLMVGSSEPGPELAIGSRYVLFLSTYDGVPTSLLNPWQAFFEVRDNEIVPDPENDLTLGADLQLALGFR